MLYYAINYSYSQALHISLLTKFHLLFDGGVAVLPKKLYGKNTIKLFL
jgi:hypothetical protein